LLSAKNSSHSEHSEESLFPFVGAQHAAPQLGKRLPTSASTPQSNVSATKSATWSAMEIAPVRPGDSMPTS